MQSKYAKLPFLPETSLQQIAPGVTLSRPLSRRGYGPGLIVIVPSTGVAGPNALAVQDGVPSPMMKWAEESFVVVEIVESALEGSQNPIVLALGAIAASDATKPANSGVVLIGAFPFIFAPYGIVPFSDRQG